MKGVYRWKTGKLPLAETHTTSGSPTLCPPEQENSPALGGLQTP